MGNLLWLQMAGCGGCTVSLLDACNGGFWDNFHRLGGKLLWHPALSLEDDPSRVFAQIFQEEINLDILCLEGAIAGNNFPLEILQKLASKARYVIAAGSCSSFGGIPLASGGLTGMGVQYLGHNPGALLDEEWLSQGKLPVINIAGCPPHPDWLAEAILGLLMEDVPKLDSLGRPKAFSDHLAHHGCNRNEYYEFKASALRPSHLGCLMENLGCKATQAAGDCNRRRWNGFGSCTNAGFPCISCTSPNFEETGHSFMETAKIAGIPIALPTDMPKAWFVALVALSKSAMPDRVKKNATSDHVLVPPEP